MRAAVGSWGSCQGVPALVRARLAAHDLRGRFHADRAHHDACIAASGCDGAGARLRRISGGGDAEPSPRPPCHNKAPRPREMSEAVDETVVSKGPRDVVHHYDLLPQLAAVLTTNVATKTSHLLLNLVGRELSTTTARDGAGRRGEWYEAVFDALAPAEARARVSQVERPLLDHKIEERRHQTIGSRATTVFTKDTPRDTPKSPEHVDPWKGPLPIPRRTFHQSNLCPTKGTKKMAAPREGESVRGLVQDRLLHARHGARRGADCTQVSSKSLGHVDRRRQCGLTSASLALAGRLGLPEMHTIMAETETGTSLPEMEWSRAGVARNVRRDPPLE